METLQKEQRITKEDMGQLLSAYMFAGKAWAYMGEAPFRCSMLG
jgi:hypothetical protein